MNTQVDTTPPTTAPKSALKAEATKPVAAKAPAAPLPDPVDPIAAALEAPGHNIGDRIEIDSVESINPDILSAVAVDKLARVWRTEENENGTFLVLVGRLNV